MTMKKKIIKFPCDELDIPGVGKALKHPGCEDEVVGLPDYSLDEQDTGRKWIDGRPIFCKTLSFTMNVGSPTEVPHGIEGMDHIVGQGYEGALRRKPELNEQWIKLGASSHPSVQSEQMLVTVNRINLRIDDAGTLWDGKQGYCTLFYVKL